MELPVIHPLCRRDGTDNRVGAFLRGFREAINSFDRCGSSIGVTYDNDSESPRSRAYDRGRDLRLKMYGVD